jgi:hypothetical protein
MSVRPTKGSIRRHPERSSDHATSSMNDKVHEAWRAFRRQLRECIAELEVDDILILARKTANQYVQVHHWGYSISAEAASNAYIAPPTALLDERQYARILRMGWDAPTVSPEQVEEAERNDEGYEGSPNFHRVFDTDDEAIADILINTLRRGFGVSAPAELLYRSFTANGQQQIRWTALKIRQAPY